VLIDAFVVRTVLVPALLSLLGRFSAWPRKLNGADAEPAPSQAPAGVPDDHHDAELTSHHA
jgi:putative drug exporter of the RND superfamily